MTMVQSSSVSRAPRPSSLADVLDLILDKGLVIDAYVRVSVAGIELLTIDARIVIASVDTYLRFAEAVNRLDLTQTEQKGLQALTGSGEDEEEGGESGEDEDDKGSSAARSRDGSGAAKRRQPASEQGSSGDDDSEEPGLLERLADRAKFER
ncbi:MAG: gas vesicle protein GvpJ [Acidimicrobiales bacterium]